MPGNYPEESVQDSEHGKSLKSRIFFTYLCVHFLKMAKYVSQEHAEVT